MVPSAPQIEGSGALFHDGPTAPSVSCVRCTLGSPPLHSWLIVFCLDMPETSAIDSVVIQIIGFLKSSECH